MQEIRAQQSLQRIRKYFWSGKVGSSEELDRDYMVEETIPSWINACHDWQEEFKKDGLEGLHVCIQNLSAPDGEVFFTVNDVELTYFVLDN